MIILKSSSTVRETDVASRTEAKTVETTRTGGRERDRYNESDRNRDRQDVERDRVGDREYTLT